MASIFLRDGNPQLVTECWMFDAGGSWQPSESFIVVVKTTPSGPPSSWTQRYVAPLLGQAIGLELGDMAELQPEIDVAADGHTLLALLSAIPNGSAHARADGCRALELDSIDPPVFHRDCDGKLVARARTSADAAFANGGNYGACSYDALSKTGIVGFEQPMGYLIYQAGLRP